MLLQGIGLGWFALAAGVGTPYPRLAVPLLVAGLGIATAMPVAVAATLGAVPPEELGTASGATSTLQRLGGALGVALAATVFAAHGSLDGPSSFAAGVRPALGLAAVLSLLGAGTALALERSPGPVAGRLPLAGRVAVGR
jgi:MFS family permease